MSPMDAAQRESVVRRLEFMRGELTDLPQFGGMTQEEYIADRNRRRNLERLAENVVNDAVDIAKIILAGEAVPIPETYRETILLLHQAGVLEKGLALQMAEMVRLRNILAHQYLDIRWEALSRFVGEGGDVPQQFIAAVEKKLAG